MISNYREPKEKLPKSWFKMRECEREAILNVFNEEYHRSLDHEGAEVQKIMLKLYCIVNHAAFGHGKLRNIRGLQQWKRLYKKLATIKSAEERDAFINGELEKIFGKDGYPSDWVDKLEDV
jgi:hypothetical protein